MIFHLEDRGLLKQQCFIGGTWVDADSGSTTIVIDPATGAAVASVPQMGAAETRRAIECAGQALAGWSERTAEERAEILWRWHALVLVAVDDLAAIMTAEQGKPLAESKGEVAYAASFIRWFAEEGRRTYGEIIPNHRHDSRLFTLRQPVGVCAAITPWNFPAAMVTRKVAPALAAGCTIIVKPAPQTPFTALALAALAERAGLPKGVLNVMTGAAAEIGEALMTSSIVRKIICGWLPRCKHKVMI